MWYTDRSMHVHPYVNGIYIGSRLCTHVYVFIEGGVYVYACTCRHW